MEPGSDRDAAPPGAIIGTWDVGRRLSVSWSVKQMSKSRTRIPGYVPLVARRLFTPCLLALCLAACRTEVSPRSGSSSAIPAFVVEEISPADDAVEVPRDGVLIVHLSASVDRDSLGADLESLRDIIVVERLENSAAFLIEGDYELDSSDTRIVFTPANPWKVPGIVYRVTVFPGILDLEGQELDVDDSDVPNPSHFTTENVVDETPPVFDGISAIEVVSRSALRISWELADDDFSTISEIFYRIYRNDPPAEIQVDYSNPVAVTLPEMTDLLLTGLKPDTEYTVGIRAVDGSGNESDNLETLSARTVPLPPDVTPPIFAGIEDLITISTTSVEARWPSATDDRDRPGNIRYTVYVATSDSITFDAPLLTTVPGVTQITLEDLDPDTLHSVAVRAIDTSDNEDGNLEALQTRTLVSFSDNVFPILSTPSVGGCTRSFCHSESRQSGGLVMTTHEKILAGGNTKSPRMVEPGDATASLMIWRIDEVSPNYLTEESRMPLGRPALSPAQIGIIRRWIDQGALDDSP